MEFSKLPTISRKNFLQTPLSKRRYKDARALVKIVHSDEGPFLSEWAFDDIGREPWGLPSTRPMVYLTDPHEAVEKSMWCYENNMLPLIGEKDPDIAMFAAGKYKIDSLIVDPLSLPKLLPYLKSRTEKFSSVSILVDSFDVSSLLPFIEYAENVRLVLSLPEVGGMAVAPLTETLHFRALPNCIIEESSGTLVVTKIAELVTPIIRYATTIPSGILGSV